MDTKFCFTIPQSKVIAEYMVKGQYADSLETKYEEEIVNYQYRSFKDWQIQERLQAKINNKEIMLQNNEKSIGILTKQLNDRDKKLKSAKWHKILLGVASVVSSAAIILK
jgi:hypothetical protein